jgi:peptidyl-prolyl cis-trans isomerase D
MSILESLRSGTDSTWMQVILALVVVSFVFWYGQPNGDAATLVANVNGTMIMSTDLDRAYTQSVMEQPVGTDEEALARREALKEQLIQIELAVQQAERAGLVVDADPERGFSRRVALLRKSNPYFFDANGEFSQDRYDEVIRNFGFATREQYEEHLEREVLVEEIGRAMTAGLVLPEAQLRELFVKQNTKVDVRYVRVRPAAFGEQIAIDDAAVTEWIASHSGAVEQQYTADFERLYNLPEQVELRVIRLAIRDDGQDAAALQTRLGALRDQIGAAADPDAAMVDLARRFSEHPSAEEGGSLGEQKVGELAPELATLVAALADGALSDLVTTDRDVSLYRLVRRVPAREIPVDEVRLDIARRLMRDEQAPAKAAEFAERVLATWRDGGAFPAADVEAAGLVGQTTGLTTLAEAQGPFSPPRDMMQAALAAPVGAVLPQVYQTGDVLWVGAVENREEADATRFDAEKSRFEQEYIRQRRNEFFAAWLDDLVAAASIE